MTKRINMIGAAVIVMLAATGCDDYPGDNNFPLPIDRDGDSDRGSAKENDLFGSCLPEMADTSLTNELAFINGEEIAYEASFTHDTFIHFVVAVDQDSDAAAPGEYPLTGEDDAPIRVAVIGSDGDNGDVVSFAPVPGTGTIVIEDIGPNTGALFSGCIDVEMRAAADDPDQDVESEPCSGRIDVCWSLPVT